MATTSSRRHRPGRTLIVLFLVIAAFFVLMAVGKTWSPKLGLDLRGGTTITLTARNTTGSGPVSSTSLEQARTIIQQRVDSIGVGESEVTISGGNQVIVSVPNVQRDELVQMVGQTAQLAFRKVYLSETVGAAPTQDQAVALPSVPESASPRPTAPASPIPTGAEERKALLTTQLAYAPAEKDRADFAAFQCGDVFPDVPDQPLIACLRPDLTGGQGSQKYLLGPVLIDGNMVTESNAGVPQNQLAWVVTLKFNQLGSDLFLEATRNFATMSPPENQFAIVLDGKVVSAPSVSKEIPGGSAEISGSFNQKSATDLANVLKYGALPLSFDVSSVDNVSATLGLDQLKAGLVAGGVGLALVVLYCLLYYRGLALVVVASLGVAATMTYQLMVLLGASMGFALNLPGIAGAIVAIGITADSFVIYFERIRDEAREGRSIKSAVETGWQKAKRTIVVADAVSLLSAVVLFILAIGAVKGFAFTLGLTTLLDIAIVFFFTKPLMSLLANTKFFSSGSTWSGLDAEHLGVTESRLATGKSPRRTGGLRPATNKES